MLRDPDSTSRHLTVVRRHLRLCSLFAGAGFLAANIQPAYAQLQSTAAAKQVAREAEEDARDDLNFHGLDAADTLRTLSERAKQRDRENPGDTAFARVFPEGGFGDYITSQGTVSASDCELLAKRVTALGANHSLASFVADLNGHRMAIDEAQKLTEAALRGRKAAEADDELAQAALRRAYEHNALDAQKKFGKRAERLFPRIRSNKRRDDDNGDE